MFNIVDNILAILWKNFLYMYLVSLLILIAWSFVENSFSSFGRHVKNALCKNISLGIKFAWSMKSITLICKTSV